MSDEFRVRISPDDPSNVPCEWDEEDKTLTFEALKPSADMWKQLNAQLKKQMEDAAHE